VVNGAVEEYSGRAANGTGGKVDGRISHAVYQLLDQCSSGPGKDTANGLEVDRRAMKDFVDGMDVETILKEEKISVAEAVSFVERPKCEEERLIRKDFTMYLFTTGKKRKEVALCFTQKVSMTADRNFQLLSSSASERYEREVTKIILAAFRLSESRRFPAGLNDALSRYRSP